MVLPTLIENNDQLKLGPGFTMLADVGTPFPINLTTLPTTGIVTSGKFTMSFDEGWRIGGYNEDSGINFSFGTTTAGITVLQKIKAVKYVTTDETASVTLGFAAANEDTIEWAFRGGSWNTAGTGSSGYHVYTPPKPQNQIRKMFCWISADEDEFIFAPQVFQGGTVTWNRNKGTALGALTGLQFSFEDPDDPTYTSYYYYGYAGDFAASLSA